ncbi:MAG: hypothetical protein JNL51_01840 [Chitinophagaceae bacterium]|nr:hypothetical protein [Chitinophagaceae bacterium]
MKKQCNKYPLVFACGLFIAAMNFSFTADARHEGGERHKTLAESTADAHTSTDPFICKEEVNTPKPLDNGPAELPARYFWLMDSFVGQLDEGLKAFPEATLADLDKQFNSKHFPFAILGPAVLYAKKHPSNKRYHDPRMLALALRIGDKMAAESAKGDYGERADGDWETYMWLETYRLLINELGEERKSTWKNEIVKYIKELEEECLLRINFGWYNTPYTGTSPNHYSIYASIVYLAGKVFKEENWVKIGGHILNRFATVEQTPDGYWGELVRSSPTIGYNHLTLSSVALYWEHSGDKLALPALRRATDFHKNFTYPNGEPVELMNDRNRYWTGSVIKGKDASDPNNYLTVSPWAQFAFTNFPDGRRYVQFLASFFKPENMNVDLLGRLAQNTLYYHEGPLTPIPQDQQRYQYRLKQVEGGISKNGPWVTAFSGLYSPQAILNRFYLDRQGNFSVFHKQLGQIITGANSKRQPELATFQEKLQGDYHTIPMSSRLQLSADTNRLSLAYNTFFADLYVPKPTEKELKFRFVISSIGNTADDPALNLQLCLRSGKMLETGAGKKIMLSDERIDLSPAEIGGWIKHNGWTLQVDPTASLSWPVYPFNPYADKPEQNIVRAVGRLTVPLKLRTKPGGYVRPDDQEISFLLKTE